MQRLPRLGGRELLEGRWQRVDRLFYVVAMNSSILEPSVLDPVILVGYGTSSAEL